jgi:hypothetical protein
VIGRLRRRSVFLLSVLGLASCGGNDVVLGDGRSGSAVSERPVPTFTRISVVDGVSAPGTVDDDPTLTADLTQMYFDSEREGGLGGEDIWRSARTDPDQAWSTPEIVTELNSTDRETGIALSANGLSIWFSSNRTGTTGGLDVFVATRPTVSAPWSAVARVDELCTADDDLVSAVDAAETALYLARRSSADSDYDLYVSERSENGIWGAPVPIAELNTSGAESDAFPVERDTGLIFTKSEDLVIARRNAASDPYGASGTLSGLNSPEDDRDPWATDDLSYVVFSSNRSGEYLLYEAWR